MGDISVMRRTRATLSGRQVIARKPQRIVFITGPIAGSEREDRSRGGLSDGFPVVFRDPPARIGS